MTNFEDGNVNRISKQDTSTIFTDGGPMLLQRVKPAKNCYEMTPPIKTYIQIKLLISKDDMVIPPKPWIPIIRLCKEHLDLSL